MRLPGGEYKKPGAESWRNLQIKSGGGASPFLQRKSERKTRRSRGKCLKEERESNIAADGLKLSQ